MFGQISEVNFNSPKSVKANQKLTQLSWFFAGRNLLCVAQESLHIKAYEMEDE